MAAFVGAASALQAYAASQAIRCISAFAPKLDYKIIASRSVADLKQIAGHTFGITQAGTVSEFVPALMMKQVGVNPKQVRWAAMGNSATRLQGVIAK